MRFCRYCGAPIPEDSLFCPKCGKRLGHKPRPRLDRIVRTLRLKTPYPYFFAMLVAGLIFGAAALRPKAYDYSQLKWSIRSDRSELADSAGEFHQAFWLIVENTGAAVVRNIPVRLRARVEPGKGSTVSARFQRAVVALRPDAATPLILEDAIEPGEKRLYRIDGAVRAAPPFTVTYELTDPAGKVLTPYAAAY